MSTASPLNIVFAGTPDYAAECLRALIEAKHHITAVYTQPDRPAGRGQKLTESPVKQVAKQHQLAVYQPKSLRDTSAQAELAALNADVIVVAAYGLILPQAVLDIPKHGCINIHPSLLPRWRGAAPIQHTLLAGDEQTGVTIMQMEAGLDTGPMLLKQLCPINPAETSQTLHDKLATLGGKAICQALENLSQLTPEAQDDDLSTYADKISKQDAELDWHQPAVTLWRKVRALNPIPVAYFYLQQQPIRVWQAELIEQIPPSATPGTILKADAEGLDIACQEGALRLTELQLPGKKRSPVANLLNAYAEKFPVGSQLST